jgi:hypothetical protein
LGAGSEAEQPHIVSGDEQSLAVVQRSPLAKSATPVAAHPAPAAA